MDSMYTDEFYQKVFPDAVQDFRIDSNVCSYVGQSYIYSDSSVSDMVRFNALNDAAYVLMPYEVNQYISGFLQNHGNSEYVTYCYINDEQNITCILIYDLEVGADEEPVPGEYPYLQLTLSDSGHDVIHGQTSDLSYPDLSYASFGNMSDIRFGMGISETYAMLFFMGFFVIFVVLREFFNKLCRRGER